MDRPTKDETPIAVPVVDHAVRWWEKINLWVWVIAVCVVDASIVYFTGFHIDLVTGIALVTLLFMTLQTEHERCDKVRAGWREIRAAMFTLTSATQWAQQKRGDPEQRKYDDEARASFQVFYKTLLLNSKDALREEYRKVIKQKQEENAALSQILSALGPLDYKAEQMFKTWRLVWL